ncbi:MAG: PIN domain-containing protein, partial [Methanobrevibacter sp.]|nr:PIN domain-containing protein [Methanobrevibacter sp.]
DRNMIFLDTDIISYYFHGNNKITTNLIKAFKSKEPVAITIINVYEISKGLKYKNNTKKIKHFKKLLKHLQIFSLDDKVISEAATIYSNLRKIGKSIGDADILIAATVIKNKGILISNNTKHYENIANLNLMNWL